MSPVLVHQYFRQEQREMGNSLGRILGKVASRMVGRVYNAGFLIGAIMAQEVLEPRMKEMVL